MPTTIVSHLNDGVKFSEGIGVDEAKVRWHVDEVVRSSVEETLNGLLEAEADDLCGANRYERSAVRLDTRSGHYERELATKAGEVRLNAPRLRSLSAYPARVGSPTHTVSPSPLPRLSFRNFVLSGFRDPLPNCLARADFMAAVPSFPVEIGPTDLLQCC